jgi:uncharacterized protein (TIGR00251 family)
MWFKIQDQQVILKIFAKPHAKQTTLVKFDESQLHIALHAKPHEGEANKELISYLATLLQLPKTRVVLLRGEHSRYKMFIVPLNPHIQEFLEDPINFR